MGGWGQHFFHAFAAFDIWRVRWRPPAAHLIIRGLRLVPEPRDARRSHADWSVIGAGGSLLPTLGIGAAGRSRPGRRAGAAVGEARRLPPRGARAHEGRHDFCGARDLADGGPRRVKIATDYNDYLRPSVVPDIATMNRAHT